MIRAGLAARGLVVSGRVLQIDGLVETDEPRSPGIFDRAQCLHRRADGTGLAAVRMNDDAGTRDTLANVVDLGFDGGEVFLRAALQHKIPAELSQPRNADHVLPDVLRQDQCEACKQFFLAVTLALEAHAVRVKKNRTAVAEVR